MEQPGESGASLLRRVVQTCRQRRRATKVVDSTGAALAGGALLARALGLRRLLRRLALRPDERYVGILLPPSVGAVVTNLALALDRRVVVNLNYTLTAEMLDGCIAQAGIRHVLTSRRFLEGMPVALEAEVVYLEDLRDKPTPLDKLIAAFQAYLLPVGLLLRGLGLDRVAGDEVLTVIFTSGTTGPPKGVVLTYGNVAANLATGDHVLRRRPGDVVIGVLPFFHAYGSTVTLWFVLVRDLLAAYHVNPLDGQVIGRLCREQRGTILLATPLFLRTYLRRGEPADFATLEVIGSGGERLPRELSDAVERTFGRRPVEGYGATEMSPLISSNVPTNRPLGDPAAWYREGTVGRPVPGVRARVTDLETGAELGAGRRGLLWVTGPNLMRGYLGQPEATAEVIRDGWYRTGDIAVIDADGFIEIVGRASRFAKIGGEMVPHLTIEEALTTLIGLDEGGNQRAVVTSIPDPERGERLVVVHTPLSETPDELRRGLAAAGLPNLFLPAAADFRQVDQLPRVGIGKLDLKRINQIAREEGAKRGEGAEGGTASRSAGGQEGSMSGRPGP